MLVCISAAQARADEGGDLAACENMMSRLDQVYDVGQMNDCIDFYWHHGEYDVGFNPVIRIGYRIVTVDPQQTQTYTEIAWLLWSKWVTWHNHPADMPDGETKADEAVALLLRGRDANPTDAAYHLDAAQTLEPLAQFHQPERYAFVLESYALADRYATDNKIKIRARLSTGHIYRRQKNKAEALRYYNLVLELDPQNKVALRCIAEINGGG